ncbi:helix-turn-helix transcriptional regulator [Janibacter sp. YIM B02568]|uniref:helix-turn-helix domain-containing protein n=1 Tax=Janibacter endophyticus TaxID=2806261 RepID=UPI00194F2A00|nr:helix-turn-helix transcriptional regulator [Janibacter endophyticus]MBM6547267.1 helix-turn-helix transcriptional regulator [Janibacter endophyticus]
MAQLWNTTYTWRLRALMAERGMYMTTDIIPHLAEHGINLSSSQAHRLVTGTPERLNLHVLSALCHILGVTSDELINSQTHLIGVRPKAVGDPRPRRNQTSPPVRPVHVRLTTTDTPEQR